MSPRRRISILVPLTLEGIGPGPLQNLLLVYERVKAEGTSLEVDQVTMGPSTIDSRYDEAIAGAFSLEAIQQAVSRGVDAVLCSCFGDVGLTGGRELSPVPVTPRSRQPPCSGPGLALSPCSIVPSCRCTSWFGGINWNTGVLQSSRWTLVWPTC